MKTKDEHPATKYEFMLDSLIIALSMRETSTTTPEYNLWHYRVQEIKRRCPELSDVDVNHPDVQPQIKFQRTGR
jgi:hypothetical protein